MIGFLDYGKIVVGFFCCGLFYWGLLIYVRLVVKRESFLDLGVG